MKLMTKRSCATVRLHSCNSSKKSDDWKVSLFCRSYFCDLKTKCSTRAWNVSDIVIKWATKRRVARHGDVGRRENVLPRILPNELFPSAKSRYWRQQTMAFLKRVKLSLLGTTLKRQNTPFSPSYQGINHDFVLAILNQGQISNFFIFRGKPFFRRLPSLQSMFQRSFWFYY